MWLVEAKIYPKVTLLLLVKGCTQNSADRMFNLMKLTYHCRDIFTYDELHSVLSENEFVNVIKMSPSNFHDHIKWQDQHYRVPEKGNFNRRHVFCISGLNQGSQPTMLTKKDEKESPVRKDSLLPTPMNRKAKKLNPAERVIEIKRMEQDLGVLQPTPLKPIKAVELWKKWLHLLPNYARLIIFPKPSNEIIDSIKERNRNKT